MAEKESEARELILAFRANRDYIHFSALASKTDALIEEIIEMGNEIKYPFPQYSSWILSHVAKNHLEKLLPHQEKLMDVFLTCTDHSAQRNLANTLKQLPFSDYKSGEILERLFDFLLDSEAKVALKVYALELMIPFVRIYPELKVEIDSIIEKESEYQTPAFRSGAKKIQKLMGKKK